MDPDLFTSDYWRERGLIVGEAPGRGNSLFLQATPKEQWALRAYRRGGMVAKISEKRYLWAGAERTRAFRELRLTSALFEQGLPVPRPVASCVTRYGFCYEAAIITVRIEGAQALAERLIKDSVNETLLQQVGLMIKRFHQVGLDHVDLNARNILVDSSDTPWLIDFDRCRLRAPGKWKANNLDRLARSLEKLKVGSAIHSIKTGYTN
ncbi:3-deoxy-D-manno-octulosonic acid kinase [Vreelandella boliviensis LC1]|uniref:3-deoxy-D-manno-octulosonic acid kinase n=2 Tax=Vreelandella boliviensis TaxID=223527 RepID=A0A265DYN5_9GAMM|nr:3-deoxy-D-manno-octulosonic acid kinase [Halomonas boliviensis LC1]OZT74432.1 3-deoxy-D-manno-octulosonic acid kinase [Halomonas boliviensis LC1]